MEREFVLWFLVCVSVGGWVGEWAGVSSVSVCVCACVLREAFVKVLLLMQRKAYFTLASYSDNLYQSLLAKLHSPEWQATLKLRKQKQVMLNSNIMSIVTTTPASLCVCMCVCVIDLYVHALSWT